MSNKVISFLGSRRDNRGFGEKRWEKWRPNISLCMQEDFKVDELILIAFPNNQDLTALIINDIKKVSCNTKVSVINIELGDDPWDFAQAYDAVEKIYNKLPKNTEYFVNISTGTHATQFAMASLMMSGSISGKLIQVAPNSSTEQRSHTAKGSIRFIDFSLSKYDPLYSQFIGSNKNNEELLKNGIKTNSSSYNSLINKIETVSVRSNTPILLTGETGAGKTQLASQIYSLKKSSERVSGEFISVNCATLNGNSEGAKSSLFGHTKGAFTGANSERKGFLTLADKGVLFLDEIATLGMEEQGMLLHALENKEFHPLGSEKRVKSSFTLICGTNENLKEAVKNGTFRADLLARINLWSFKLPSLRDRKEDIEPNIQFEIAKQNKELGHKLRFNTEAKEAYVAFSKSKRATWLGNFRDLSGSISRMATLSEGGIIDLANVQDEIYRLLSDWESNDHDADVFNIEHFIDNEFLYNESLVELDRIELVIRTCLSSENQKEAGIKLFHSKSKVDDCKNPGSRLANYLSKYDLTFQLIAKKAAGAL